MANYDEHKLEAFGLLKEGLSAKEVSRQLKVPYPIILKWKPELESLDTKADLETVLNTDKVVLHELASRVKEDFEELKTGSSELVQGVLEKINGAESLQEEFQHTGSALNKKINELIDIAKHPHDILALVEAIAKLQTAFFSKGANVNVLNVPGGTSNKTISKYAELQRPM